MSTRICSLPQGQWLRIRVDVLTIRLPVFVSHGLKIWADVLPVSARMYSPCATDTGKQGELHLCRYLHIGIGLAVVHRCPQLLASLENSSADQVRLPVFVATSNTVSSFRITSPYHHGLFCCSTKIISSIPSLCLNSLLGTLSFTLTSHIQLTILISACCRVCINHAPACV